MLAVVDNFAGSGMLIRRGAPAKIRSALKERNTEAGFGQGASRRKAS